MEARVKEFRGVGSCVFNVAHINFIAGRNGAGKSSVILGLAAAVTGDASMGGMVMKKDSIDIIADGASAADASIGDTSMHWTKTITSPTTGKDISCSMVAASGAIPVEHQAISKSEMKNPAVMKDADRKAYFADLLGMKLTKEVVKDALGKELYGKYGDDVFNGLMQTGWGKTEKAYKEARAYQSGKWCELTGNKRMGSKIAAEWEEMKPISADEVEEAVADAQGDYDTAVAHKAVMEYDRDNLESVVAKSADNKKRLEALNLKVTAIETKRSQNKAAMVPVIETYECPSCCALLSLNGDNELSLTGKSISDTKDDTEKNEVLKAKNSELDIELRDIKAKIRELDTEASAIKSAKEKLVAIDSAANSCMTIETAQLALDNARELERVYRQEAEALTALTEYRYIEKVLEILSPDGLRKSLIKDKLLAVNDVLEMIKFERPASIDSGLNIFYGTRPYALCCESERWRVRFAIQLLCAEFDDSNLLIADGADILDKTGRNKLLRIMMSHGGITFVVGMTANTEDQVPDIEAKGIQRVWIG